jgi:TPR repeat protein
VEYDMARIEFSSHDSIECAALGGQPDALLELGLMFATGRGGRLDLVEAHKFFNLAALRGNEQAKRYRNELSADMSKSDIARAQRLAREFLSDARH